MAHRSLPRKVTYFEPVPPRLAGNAVSDSTSEVGRRFRCTMRVDRGQLDLGATIRPARGEWRPRMLERLDQGSLRTGARAAMRSIGSRGSRSGRGSQWPTHKTRLFLRTGCVADSFL